MAEPPQLKASGDDVYKEQHDNKMCYLVRVIDPQMELQVLRDLPVDKFLHRSDRYENERWAITWLSLI